MPKETTVGNVTFAHIDTPSDRWLWSIVQGYKGPQDYGDIICEFEDGGEPEPQHLDIMLQALNRNLLGDYNSNFQGGNS